MNCQKILSLFMVLILSFGMCTIAFAENETDCIPIYDEKDFNSMRENLNGKFILMNNIDLSDYKNWVPIGNKSSPFCGSFDGNSFVIKNIKINDVSGSESVAGLFGTIKNSIIKNVAAVGEINVSGNDGMKAGLICGEAYDSIISDCITYGSINVYAKSAVSAGGIAGFFTKTPDTVDNTEPKIELCQNNASVSVNASCESKNTSFNFFVGGVVGFTEGEISKSSNRGNVIATGISGTYDYLFTLAGGICGNSNGVISDCYNVGNVCSTGSKYVFAGGISGFWSQFYDIFNCYNMGQIKSESKNGNYSDFGGLIGCVDTLLYPDSSENSSIQLAKIQNCYYLNNAEKAFGDAIPENLYNINSLSAKDFLNKSSFTGYDFESTWKMSENEQRPLLQDEAEHIIKNIESKTGKTVRLKDIEKSPVSSCFSVNKSIATVDGNANIKGLSTGKTTVVIFTNDGTVLECNITVEFSLFWWLINFFFGWMK